MDLQQDMVVMMLSLLEGKNLLQIHSNRTLDVVGYGHHTSICIYLPHIVNNLHIAVMVHTVVIHIIQVLFLTTFLYLDLCVLGICCEM
jgi:hypothetical protein